MRTLAIVAAVTAAAPSLVRADRVWTKANPKANPFERKDVVVQKIEGGNLVFKVIQSDRQDSKPLAEIWQIEVTTEPKLNAAEAAFVAGDYAKATDEYRGAMEGSKAPWVKVRAAARMVESATAAKNFTGAVKGYAALVKLDATLAASFKPVVPTGAPGTLGAAVGEAKSAATSSGVTSAQKEQLLTLALELARANGDNKEATAIAELLAGAADVGPAVNPGGGAVTAGDANKRIQLALVALGNKQFDQALKQINSAPEVFAEPADQVEALFILGEAKNGMAKTSDELKDAALDYMRMVARSKSANLKSPRVPEALYKTAVILERIRASEEAALLYQQITAEFGDSDAATSAKAAAALQRLEKGAEK